MIHSVTVTNYLGESIKLEMRAPEKSGLLIKSIEGVGPSTADINYTELSSNDGAMFNSSRVRSRNIVMQLGFKEMPTIEDTRHLTYKYFPTKKRVLLDFETDRRTCRAVGYVESNVPDIFSKDEGAQISIVCPDPYFYSKYSNVSLFTGLTSIFEFPFSNESLEDSLMIFGEITNLTANTIFYEGDADVGVLITINAIGPATNVDIYNPQTGQIMKIDTTRLEQLTGSGIISGDEIRISTVRGSKFVTLLREGFFYNILNTLARDADWIQLTRGDNIFAYTAETGAANLQFKVENQIVYEGI